MPEIPRVSRPAVAQISTWSRIGRSHAARPAQARESIAAIRPWKELESTGRAPAAAEQTQLVRFIGFGATELAQNCFPLPGRAEFRPGWVEIGRELDEGGHAVPIVMWTSAPSGITNSICLSSVTGFVPRILPSGPTNGGGFVMPCGSDAGGPKCYVSRVMTTSIAELTAGDRTYIRRELDLFFATLSTIAEGFQLRTWRTGPRKGQPKLPPAAQSLVERGLMRLDAIIHRRDSFSRTRDWRSSGE